MKTELMDEYIRDVGILKYQEGLETGIQAGEKAGILKGEKVGIQKGIGINQKDVAKRMYSNGFDPGMISTCSGADLDTVQKWLEEFSAE